MRGRQHRGHRDRPVDRPVSIEQIGKRFLLEERLDAGKDMFGISDPTPRLAIANIINPRK